MYLPNVVYKMTLVATFPLTLNVGYKKNFSSADEKDGRYFLKILENETKRLLALAAVAEKELEANLDLCEEAKGFLRSASGKAKLLVSQKMQQFKGLCTKNITQVSSNEKKNTFEEVIYGIYDILD